MNERSRPSPSEGHVALSCSGRGRINMKIVLPITATAALIMGCVGATAAI